MVSQSNSARVRRSGLTLVEMLVSVALTLLVVLAVVRIFDVLGTNVRRSRSALELSAQLRNVANQLQHDLDRITASTIPPVKQGSGSGFLEILEGPDRDRRNASPANRTRPTWGILHDFQANQGNRLRSLDAGRPAPPFTGDVDESGWYGDLDDVLMFTIASEDKPFVGRFGPPGAQRIIRSKYALVAWWVERSMLNGTPLAFRLHRRQLLIDPTIGTAAGLPNDIVYMNSFDASNPAQMNAFLNINDLAIRPPSNAEMGASIRHPFAATLDDLSIRRNRWGHAQAWPNPLILPRIAENAQLQDPSSNFAAGSNTYSNVSNAWTIYTIHSKRSVNGADFAAEDVVLGDLLAFDVKVYDPQAPLHVDNPTTPSFILSPKDSGYVIPPPADRTMRGAFVDLFYALGDPNFANPAYGLASHFSFLPHLKSGLQPAPANFEIAPAVFDTWTDAYERDGFNQGGLFGPDSGSNGIDDNNNGLVDEPFEADTFPPYSDVTTGKPYPLRGIEVTIRAVELSTQQIRQVSVVADFQAE